MNTIEEKNHLISEFMGLVKSSVPSFYWTKKSIEGFGIGQSVELKYHKDWNWLMEVVEKIESLDFYSFEIKKYSVCVYKYNDDGENVRSITSKYATYRGTEKIRATYDACVEFIKWYNEQEK